jgi:hypothetical protein
MKEGMKIDLIKFVGKKYSQHFALTKRFSEKMPFNEIS